MYSLSLSLFPSSQNGSEKAENGEIRRAEPNETTVRHVRGQGKGVERLHPYIREGKTIIKATEHTIAGKRTSDTCGLLSLPAWGFYLGGLRLYKPFPKPLMRASVVLIIQQRALID